MDMAREDEAKVRGKCEVVAAAAEAVGTKVFVAALRRDCWQEDKREEVDEMRAGIRGLEAGS